MNRADVFLAVRYGQAISPAAAWSRLVHRLGGQEPGELADPLIAVFPTPEQAMVACMTLLDSPPIDLENLGGVGLHIDQFSPENRALSFGGKAIAIALSEQATPGTACLSIGMRDTLTGKLDTGFSPVEELPRLASAARISFVRIHGPGATVENVSSRSDHLETPGEPGEQTITAFSQDRQGPPLSVSPSGPNQDATVVMIAEPPDQGRSPRDMIVALTREISEYETLASRLIEEGAFQAGIEALDHAIHLAGEHVATTAMKEWLTGWRVRLIDPVKVTGAAIIEVAETRFILLPHDVLSLGRSASTGTQPDIEISCRLVSRANGGLRLSRSHGGIRLERQGGVNSVFVDDAFLEAGEAIDLHGLDRGVTLSLGGANDPPLPGDCRLRLTSIGPDRTVLSCRVDLTHLDGRVTGDLENLWPGWREDKDTVWLAFSDIVDIGGSDEAVIRIDPTGASKADAIQALLRYDETSGYSLELAGADIKIDGFKTSGDAPMRDGTVIDFGSTVMTFSRAGER